MESTPKSITGRKWFQFRLRTLLLGMAVLALALGLGPRLWHRYRVNQAIDAIVEDGLGAALIFPGGGGEELDWVASDVERATAKLMRVVRDSSDSHHRVHALQAIRCAHFRTGSGEIRRRHLGEMITLATDGGAPVAVEQELAETIADWIPGVGADSRERSLILARAEQVDGQLLLAWIEVLIEIGGRRELAFVFQRADGAEEEMTYATFNSSLIRCHWPGMLPHVRKWLRNPSAVECRLLEYSILGCTDKGRGVLLAYVINPENPLELRRLGFEELQGNLAEVNLLMKAAQTSRGLAALHSLGPDPVGTLEARHKELQEQYDSQLGEKLIQELIHGLTPAYWIPGVPRQSPEVEKQLAELRRQSVDENLRCLQILLGRDDIDEVEEWRQWHESNPPTTMNHVELLQLCRQHPELMNSTAVLRRFTPHHLGYVPADCLPLYLQMAKDPQSNSAYWACQTLLLYTDDVSCVPYVIDMIDRASPANVSSSHPGVISMLKDRFGVNFFWDTDAWRRWWREYQEEHRIGAPDGSEQAVPN